MDEHRVRTDLLPEYHGSHSDAQFSRHRLHVYTITMEHQASRKLLKDTRGALKGEQRMTRGTHQPPLGGMLDSRGVRRGM
jgi:hypothetical protein